MFEMNRNGRWFCRLGIVFGTTMVFGTTCVYAQITPDGTLPNNSIVTPNGNAFNITGGTTAGGNLFHSFREFSVPNASAAIFNNAVNIQNIISRVTGGSISTIDGLIRTSGSANLFLINPNGIVFGQNARLDVGGSFVASTASAIQFGNQGFFSATNPDASAPLLTINPTALFYNQIAGRIENNSTALLTQRDPAGFPIRGLRVPDGKSLLLIGGNINMNGGQLNAYGGRIELSGLADTGSVALNFDGNNVIAGFPTESAFADVSLTGGAAVYVEAAGGGSITVNARNLDITSGSTLSAGIGKGLGSDSAVAGDIVLNAKGEIKVVGAMSSVGNNVAINASGLGGNLAINAQRLLVSDGAEVSTSTFGAGKGGNLTVNADTVELIGSNAVDGSASGLFTSADKGLTGSAGDLSITTQTLLVRDGAEVNAGTFGAGNGGNLTVNADRVELIGTNAVDGSASGLFTSADKGLTGSAGDLSITTQTLLVRDGAEVNAGTFGAGNGGNLTVNADRVELIGTNAVDGAPSGLFTQAEGSTGNAGDLLITTKTLFLRDGAQVGASTFGAGNGGNLTVNADTVELIGTDTDGFLLSGLFTQAEGSTGSAGNLSITTKTLLLRDGATVGAGTFGAGNGGNLTVSADRVELIGRDAVDGSPSGLFTQADSGSTGSAGDLRIDTQTLLVRDGAGVSVQSLGTGSAGNLEINSTSIRLENQGSLSAESTSGNGGNINLNIADLLLLRRGSQISTSAGTAGVGGDGGNITISAPNGFIVAIPNENSDITANAFTGSGGKIQINTSGLYGIEQRPRTTPLSDITASSEQGIAGTIVINIPDVEQNLALLELPIIIDPNDQIAQNTCNQGIGSEFIITGRGGLPPSPNEDQSQSATVVGLVESATMGTQRLEHKADSIQNSTSQISSPVVPAQGWVFNAQSDVVLTAHNSTVTTPQRPPKNHGGCPAR